MHSKLPRYLIYCSGWILIPGVGSATTRQECEISEGLHHWRTGSSHSTSTTCKPEKCLLISVLVLLNADWLKIHAVTNSTLTCIAMREMKGMMQWREPPTTINSYDVFSNQMGLHSEHIKLPLPSSPQATLMDSTSDLRILALVLTFNVFRSTTTSWLLLLLLQWFVLRQAYLLQALLHQ